MPTVQQILSDIAITYPYSTAAITDAYVIDKMNDEQNLIWRFMASTDQYQFLTVAGQALYTMASDMRIDMIQSVQVSDSTVIDGTETYTQYAFAGMDDDLTGNQYFDAIGQMGLYPVPSTATGSGYSVKITYEPSPVQLSTNTLATVPSINTEYQSILKWRALRDIARAGQNPDVDMANNFEAERQEILSKIHMDYAKRRAREPKRSFSYSAGWWSGFGVVASSS